MSLTESQKNALDLLLTHPPIFILTGYAGTGKSYLINHFVMEAKKNNNVVITAPTHKALGIVEGNYTIYSYLGLVLKEEEDQLVLTPTDKAKVCRGDIVIIDEASMINTVTLDYILDMREKYDLKLVFIGDSAQLPPVQEYISPVWEMKDIVTFELTEIVRQAEDSNIIKLSTLARKRLLTRKEILDHSDESQVLTGSRNGAKRYFKDCFEQGKEIPTFISYTNLSVDRLNEWARNLVQNNPTEPYIKGEKIYIRSANASTRLKLETIATIEEINYTGTYTYLDYFAPKIVKLKVSSYLGTFFIVVPYSKQDWKLIELNKSRMANEARTKGYLWDRFWKYSYLFTDVKHIYAMTSHRSQGSTFERVIVNFPNIPNKKALYTAITRASKELFIIA
jgi:exodeoxyribonuclease-5